MNFSKILEELWSRSEGSHVFLPMRDGDTWYESDGLFPPVAVATVNWMLTAPQQVDYYFTPLKYNGRRQRDKVGRPGVIFADMDDEGVSIPMLPSLLIESSPGHMHGYWFLDQPVPLAEWEPKAREWSRHIGADRGGWDTTQVLRLPGTPNMKYEDIKVRLLEYNRHLTYSIDAFPNPREAPSDQRFSIGTVWPELLSNTQRLALVAENWERLPLSAQYYLTMTRQDFLRAGITDRSEMLWGVIQTLLETGFFPRSIFSMIHGTPWDKYTTRPETLWNTVMKAHALNLSYSPIVV